MLIIPVLPLLLVGGAISWAGTRLANLAIDFKASKDQARILAETEAAIKKAGGGRNVSPDILQARKEINAVFSQAAREQGKVVLDPDFIRFLSSPTVIVVALGAAAFGIAAILRAAKGRGPVAKRVSR